jgi:AraC family transcriptional regulator
MPCPNAPTASPRGAIKRKTTCSFVSSNSHPQSLINLWRRLKPTLLKHMNGETAPSSFAGHGMPCPYCEIAIAVLRLRSFLWPPRTSVVCDRLSGSGGGVLAKIAVELERALARRAATGAAACHPTCRVLARGDGWLVEDLICASGPQDPIFEERHGNVSIAMVLAGTFQYRGSAKGYGIRNVLMTPGSLLLGNAGQSFEVGHQHAAGDLCLSFQFAPEYFERIASDAGVQKSERGFRLLRLPPLRELSSLIARARAGLEYSADTPWEELSVELAAATVRVERGISSRVENAPPSAIARVTRSVRAIERCPDGALGLGSLAREAGLSPYHFLRTFETLTGITPHQYVRRARLRDAASRLAAGLEKVLHIALDCGFGDVSNFNRAFRTEFGVSPKNFRQDKSSKPISTSRR